MELNFEGLSMYPSLKSGDRLTVHLFSHPKSVSDIDTGRIILFKDDSEWVVHRVVEKDGHREVKGDWSYPLDVKQPVWGEVISINGFTSPVLKSPGLAKMSMSIDKDQPSWIRKLKKIKLFVFASFLRGLKRK